MDILIFDLDAHEYGIPLHVVREVVRAVEVAPLAGAPAVVEGIIDFHGSIVPVFSLRRRFGLHERPVALTDRFIIVDTGERDAALHVDGVRSLAKVDESLIRDADTLVRGGAHIAGAVTVADVEGLVLLHDVTTFLAMAEEESLDAALAGHRNNDPGQ